MSVNPSVLTILARSSRRSTPDALLACPSRMVSVTDKIPRAEKDRKTVDLRTRYPFIANVAEADRMVFYRAGRDRLTDHYQIDRVRIADGGKSIENCVI